MMDNMPSDPGRMHRTECDVAIVGGGPVGASLACALGPLGLKVVLIEAQEPRIGTSPSFDDRALALSQSSCRILQGIGVWHQLESASTPIAEIRVTERDRWGKVVLDPRELGLDRFGHVVEARMCGVALMEKLGTLGNVRFVSPATIQSLEVHDSGVDAVCSHQGQAFTLTARLLVGADGAESAVRRFLGIEEEQHDYGQTAITCNITPSVSHRGIAFECFTPTGPFALLPHSEGRCGLVWSVASEDAPGILALPDQEFLGRANSLFGNALGPWLKVGKRTSYPLKLVRAKRDVLSRVALLGNAAHAIHPVGAQGFNLGLRDVAVLAELISDRMSAEASVDPGDPGLLREYSNWRSADQEGTIAFSDGLARMYANPTSLAAIARKAGLIAHAIFPPLRRQLAIRAMGYRGRVPRLALGASLSTPQSWIQKSTTS